MGTEQPDTERMHRLFDDALDDADLTADVVPGVLAGYERGLRVRRYQAAGVALAVLATAGVAVGALPRGGESGSTTGPVTVLPATRPATTLTPTPTPQHTDPCEHGQWVHLPIGELASLHPAPGPEAATDEANCAALQKAVQAVFPTAHVEPEVVTDLAYDPRVDQVLLKEVGEEAKTDAAKASADRTKYFGSELTYLAQHPDDPGNLYMPDSYTLITSGARETFGMRLADDANVPGHPEIFVGLVKSDDCGNLPSVLVGKDHCTPVGVAGGWHGALWKNLHDGEAAPFTGVLTNGRGKTIDIQGGMNTDPMITAPPANALTEAQWAQLLDTPAMQNFADSYLASQQG